jgi:hypothetical protein
LAARFADLSGNPFYLVGSPCCAYHLGARACEGLGDAFPDSATRTRDDGDFAG